MSGHKILIVEDDGIIAARLQEILSRRGFSVPQPLPCGEDAISIAEDLRPDLVLMDIELAGELNGIMTAAILRDKYNIPSIYLSAYSDEHYVQTAKMTEPYGYLVKPVQDNELVAAIDTALYKHRLHEKLRESEERYRSLVELSPEAIVIHVDEVVVFANQATVNLFGAESVQEILGKSIYLFVDSDPENVNRIRARIGGVQSNGGVAEAMTNRYVRLDGTRFEAEARSVALLYQGRTAVMSILRDVTERKQREEALRESERQLKEAVAEKEVLLRELHHRVKNNLQVIVSLLDMEAGIFSDERVQSSFRKVQARALAMATVHEHLCGSKRLARVDLASYLGGLIGKIKQSFAPDRPIEVKVRAEDVHLSIDTALTLGLITNELATNTFKYAFPETLPNHASLEILLARDDDGIVLTIRDNGRGLPSGFDLKATTSHGLRLVNVLARQLKANVEMRSEGGCCFVMHFAERVPEEKCHG